MNNTFSNCEKLYRAVFPESYMQMRKFFRGCIISFTVEQCRSVDAVVKYKPSTRSKYHSEIHGSENVPLLSKSQRKKLAEGAKIEYYEK